MQMMKINFIYFYKLSYYILSKNNLILFKNTKHSRNEIKSYYFSEILLIYILLVV
jgi:hypothetical protein